jgi:hypothetical protein
MMYVLGGDIFLLKKDFIDCLGKLLFPLNTKKYVSGIIIFLFF